MQRRFYDLTAVALLFHSMALTGQAQLVEVRPGYIRAPFVRIFRDSDGGSHVQAPFVNAYSPGYGPRSIARGMPTVVEFGQMNWLSLNQAVREWTARFDADLGRFPSGEFWKSSLKTAEIATLVAAERDGPPAEDVRQRLRAIFEIHETVDTSPELNGVVGLASFRVLHAALGEYSTPPEQRLRRQLFSSAGELYRSLQHYNTGARWQEYLMLSPGRALAEARLAGAEFAPNLAELTAALGRFDSVRRNPEYGEISRLPAFKATHELLAVYVQQVQMPPPTPDEPSPEEPSPEEPSPEVLPLSLPAPGR